MYIIKMHRFQNGLFVITLMTILSQVVYSSLVLKILSLLLLSYYMYLLWKHGLINEPSLFLFSVLILFIYLFRSLFQTPF
jgi:hypothetical protein